MLKICCVITTIKHFRTCCYRKIIDVREVTSCQVNHTTLLFFFCNSMPCLVLFLSSNLLIRYFKNNFDASRLNIQLKSKLYGDLFSLPPLSRTKQFKQRFSIWFIPLILRLKWTSAHSLVFPLLSHGVSVTVFRTVAPGCAMSPNYLKVSEMCVPV